MPCPALFNLKAHGVVLARNFLPDGDEGGRGGQTELPIPVAVSHTLARLEDLYEATSNFWALQHGRATLQAFAEDWRQAREPAVRLKH